jgi:hypothetical protein
LALPLDLVLDLHLCPRSASTSTTTSSKDSGIDFTALGSQFSPNHAVGTAGAGAGNSSAGLLAEFGLAAALVTAVAVTAPGGNGLNKDSTLKVAIIIVNPNVSSIVLHGEPNDPTVRSGSWSEKILFDDLCRGTHWTVDINMSSHTLKWMHDNQ